MPNDPFAINSFNDELATRLADLRKSQQTSQATLADELGLDQAAVSRVESGHRQLTVGEAFAWLEALGLDPDCSATELGLIWKHHGIRPPGFWKV